MAAGPVLVVNYGSQDAQLIARRVREEQVYSEVVPYTTPVEDMLERAPSAIILSSGPSSVHTGDAPRVDPALFETGIPIFGISYGFQVMAEALGGTVEHTGTHDHGQAEINVAGGVVHEGLPARHTVWMDHRDRVTVAPDGFTVTASSANLPIAGFENADRRIAGVQYHPEAEHSPHGQQVLRHFLYEFAGIRPEWTPVAIIEDQVARIRAQIGEGHAICGLSGGVDSAVAAALVQRAIGDRLTCVFVDHGLLREGERVQVERDFVAATGVQLVTVDARDRFLAALAGVADPEQKRRIIGREFIRVFEQTARELKARGEVDFLVQGTLYPDIVESGDGTAASGIKSHHNVGGLPEDLRFALVEPLRLLFKDEVRRVGMELELPEAIVHRQPFPGPGLAIRIVGDVNAERLDILRAADAIAREELSVAGLDRDIWQCPVVLLADVRSVGVQGDRRTYGHPVVLRPVTSQDAMTAEWSRLPYDVIERISARITGEVPEVNRVVLDVTGKPPGTIEWE